MLIIGASGFFGSRIAQALAAAGHQVRRAQRPQVDFARDTDAEAWVARIVHSVALYLLAGVCWLPVVWMQLRMRDMAQDAAQRDLPLPARYWRYLRVWVALGVVAFAALVAVFWLMVAKPQ